MIEPYTTVNKQYSENKSPILDISLFLRQMSSGLLTPWTLQSFSQVSKHYISVLNSPNIKEEIGKGCVKRNDKVCTIKTQKDG